jgi:peptidoglycan/xylan/chitin deacetylase (PgdA/CDA1 family)
MRRTLKHIIIACLYYTGLLFLMKRLFRPQANLSPMVLMYHQVAGEGDTENKYLMKGLYVFQSTFEKQMAFIKKKYHPLSLSQLVDSLIENRPLPKNAVVITFDDGWRDNFLYAYPVLKKYEIPAVVFITTDFIETGEIFWFLKAAVLHQFGGLTFAQFSDIFGDYAHKPNMTPSETPPDYLAFVHNDLEEFMEYLKQFKDDQILKFLEEMTEASGSDIKELLSRRLMLSWAEINEMRDPVEAGSHGCSHRIMTALPPEVVKKELAESKKIIEEKTGRMTTLFAYPNGDCNEDIKRMVKEAGYRAAVVTTGAGDTADEPDPYAIKRINVHEGISAGIGGQFSKALFYFATGYRKNIL